MTSDTIQIITHDIVDREEQAWKLSHDILDLFKKFYLSSLREVIYEKYAKDRHSIIDAREHNIIEKAKDSSKTRRMRTSSSAEISNDGSNFSTKIICSQAVDVPSGVYIVYVIFSKLGAEQALVYRRFKEFRELHALLKKKSPKPLPPRGVEGVDKRRNLRSELIATRSHLLEEYLQIIIDSPDLRDSTEVQAWLGLGNLHDAVLADTFRRTYYRLKQSTNAWKKIIFHHNIDAIYKLMCEKIKQDVFPELNKIEELPHKEGAKLKEAYIKSVGDLEQEVNNTATGIHEQAAIAKTQILQLLEKKFELVEKLEHHSRKNAKQLLTEIFKGAWPKIESDLRLVAQELHEPLLLTLQKLTHFQILSGNLQIPVDFDQRVTDILVAASPEKIDAFESLFIKLKQTVKSHLTIQLAFALPPIVVNLKGVVQTPNFHIVNDICLIPDICRAILDSLDPANLLIVVRQILDCKYVLLQEHPANIRKVEDILDRYEQLTQGKIWWSTWGAESSGYTSFYHLWDTAGPYTDVFKTFFIELEAVNRRSLTKLSHKFGDMIHSAIKTEVRDWKGTIDLAVLGAYKSAKKSAIKQIKMLVKKFVVGIIKVGIKTQVQQLVLGPLDDFSHLSQSRQVPLDDLDQVKTQDSIYQEVFDDLLKENIEQFVEQVLLW